MAVQKSRKTRSKVGMRRSHDKVAMPAVSVDRTTGEVHLRHHITKDGYYKGKLVVIQREKPKAREEEQS